MSESSQARQHEREVETPLSVRFFPPLFEQRQGWILDVLRRENVHSVVDVGCGEGRLLSALCNPAPWLEESSPTKNAKDTEAVKQVKPEFKDIHLSILHGLDISDVDLIQAKESTKVPVDLPAAAFTASPWDIARLSWPAPRWSGLDVSIWKGSVEHINQDFLGVECIASTEVIEHLRPDAFNAYAPVLLGAYRPRLLLLTTPNYTFNARFHHPSTLVHRRAGHLDPTGRTSRVFRHSDHQFEWTVDEFRSWCEHAGNTWGYEVEAGGVGMAELNAEDDPWGGRDEQLGFATQVALFRRRDGDKFDELRKDAWKEAAASIATPTKPSEGHELLITHHHKAVRNAGKPQSPEEIGALVASEMKRWGEPSMSVEKLWQSLTIACACGGFLHVLLEAVELDSTLQLVPDSSCRRSEWTVFCENVEEQPSSTLDDQYGPPRSVTLTEGPKAENAQTEFGDGWSSSLTTSGQWDSWESKDGSQDSWGTGGPVDDGWGRTETETSGWGLGLVMERGWGLSQPSA